MVRGLVELGKLDGKEEKLIREMGEQLKCFASGRWLWVGGTEWSRKEKNYSGGYNCTSTDIEDVEAIGEVMELAMMGCGCGANLEQSRIQRLKKVNRRVQIEIVGQFGEVPKESRIEETVVEERQQGIIRIVVGDSREGWRDSVNALL